MKNVTELDSARVALQQQLDALQASRALAGDAEREQLAEQSRKLRAQIDSLFNELAGRTPPADA